MTLVPNMLSFIIFEIILALGASFKSGADTALIYDYLKEHGMETEAKSILSRAEGFKLFGVVLGSIIGGLVVNTFSFNEVWRLSAIPIAVSFIIAFFIQEPAREEVIERETWKDVFINGVKSLFKNKSLLAQAIDMILVSIFTYFVVWFYQLKLEQIGIDKQYYGIIHACVIFAMVAILFTTSFWDRVFGKKNYLWISALLAGIGFIGAGLINNIWSIAFLILLPAAFGSSRQTVFGSQLNTFIKGKDRATVNSSISMLGSLAIAFANPLFGALAGWNLNNTFLILGVCTIAASAVSILVQNKYPAIE
jgi:MFS family permease